MLSKQINPLHQQAGTLGSLQAVNSTVIPACSHLHLCEPVAAWLDTQLSLASTPPSGLLVTLHLWMR